MIGKSLAHYEITGLIGKGGMGEVYRARDTKLGRDVAIKVLPGEFAKDADRVARFQREAKLLASLNHPNIAAIHGMEESGGAHFLVMELIEGNTLADRIKSGPIQGGEALKLALQVTEALEAAHEKGVIHRDLKPANIKVTPDGKVKVLDFGLAKAFAGDSADMNLSNSPTLSDAATQQGVILGTAAYMSPEQAKGKAVDKKADIWAFGVVLFEMLTGKQLFAGETVSETLAAVLMKEPDFSKLPANLHPRIRFLLERCLKRDPRDRYSGISDARVDIQAVLSDPGGVFAQPSVGAAPRKKLRTALPWAAAVVLIAVLAGVWFVRHEPEPRPVMRYSHYLPGYQASLNPELLFTFAVSPDGTQLVNSSSNGLILRSVEGQDARQIAGTGENDSSPFFSPDGKWIGYHSQGQLRKIPISGGEPTTLCDSGMVLGATWNSDNTILYSDSAKGIMKVSAGGGTPELLVEGALYARPQLLPDGKSLLFTRTRQQEIIVQSLVSGDRKVLCTGIMAQYIPSGHIVYLVKKKDGYDAVTVRFEPDTAKMTGTPVAVAEGIWEAAVSPTGTLAFLSTEAYTVSVSGRTLVWVDREGNEDSLGAPPDSYRFPRISPDGSKVAFSTGDNMICDVWTWDLARKTPMRLTNNNIPDLVPVWTPDGKKLTFTSGRDGITGIYRQAADGSGEAERIDSGEGRGIIMPHCWSKDGNALILARNLDVFRFDIAVLSMEGERVPKPLLPEKCNQARLSPDGRWIAYNSSETGRGEIYVRPFPNVNGEKWQVSTEGGNSPLWSPDGKELFFLIGATSGVMSVPVETSPAFKPGKPKTLFTGTYVGFWPQDGTPWDIHPDGRRFLMMRQPPATSTPSGADVNPKITVVQNWLEELKQRVPAD